ncbi:hypothetical protein chiPu_0007984 [Chiloscyllium punctatum]|uniref:Uncharacterized protein n=1 Tax=Chiloscyllium punctatum TaxID=137246 RepID=A0A401SGK0_CHIPU|nr:hypothetical protein [Chiloscyllium punctatum]
MTESRASSCSTVFRPLLLQPFALRTPTRTHQVSLPVRQFQEAHVCPSLHINVASQTGNPHVEARADFKCKVPTDRLGAKRTGIRKLKHQQGHKLVGRGARRAVCAEQLGHEPEISLK